MNKEFKDMTQSEIEAMSDEEFKSVSPFQKKSCSDCVHLTVAMSLWCTNEEAKKARGTSMAGCIKCPYWSPNWERLNENTSKQHN